MQYREKRHGTKFRKKGSAASVSIYSLYRRSRGDRRTGPNSGLLLVCVDVIDDFCSVDVVISYIVLCCYRRILCLLTSPVCVSKVLWYVLGGLGSVVLFAMLVKADHIAGSLRFFHLANDAIYNMLSVSLRCECIQYSFFGLSVLFVIHRISVLHRIDFMVCGAGHVVYAARILDSVYYDADKVGFDTYDFVRAQSVGSKLSTLQHLTKSGHLRQIMV